MRQVELPVQILPTFSVSSIRPSLDGQYICYYRLNRAFLLPVTPQFDLSSWSLAKPEGLTLTQSEGETFNVLHVSDLHIQNDYMVVVEANCSDYMSCEPNSYNPDKIISRFPLEPATVWRVYLKDTPRILLDESFETIAEASES